MSVSAFFSLQRQCRDKAVRFESDRCSLQHNRQQLMQTVRQKAAQPRTLALAFGAGFIANRLSCKHVSPKKSVRPASLLLLARVFHSVKHLFI